MPAFHIALPNLPLPNLPLGCQRLRSTADDSRGAYPGSQVVTHVFLLESLHIQSARIADPGSASGRRVGLGDGMPMFRGTRWRVVVSGDVVRVQAHRCRP